MVRKRDRDRQDELRARLEQAERYDCRVAAKRLRENEARKQIAQEHAKIADQIPAAPMSPELKVAIARYAPSPPRWSGKGKAWLLGCGEWPGAFVEYPKRPDEMVWSVRHDDYCRWIVREAFKVGLALAPAYVKKQYLLHSKRAKPLK